MKAKVVALVFLGSVALVRGDQMIESVQQALKDQGFYYGEITGDTNANLTAAIRRYQIRNGLQVNGELNSETIRSLGINSSASGRPAVKTSPSPSPGSSDVRQESPGVAAVPGQPFSNPLQDRQLYPSSPVTPGATPGAPFAGTPYEAAPPDVQRNLVLSAQIALARRGLYRGEIDGMYQPAVEFSLRAYQARTGLPVTGRFDLETLAALELLPRAGAPIFNPSRRIRPRPEPPVHGEWVPE
ncbi:MAG TPA: peptidoglycan-binding domain-containing protein [Candidatus Udaeobacter sp.]|jgi:peptidoglycan hydrolase-like protein with peptidoglycan-binding domain